MNKRLVVTYFNNEKDLLHATSFAKKNKYEIQDVFTPYAVHGLDDAMELKTSKLGIVCFVLGITGAIAKLWYQIWTSATDWPINVGGKPLNSFPAFIPVTFEVTVLFAGIGTTIYFLLSDSRRWKKKIRPNYKTVTDSEFALVIVPNNAVYDFSETKNRFKQFNYLRMEEIIEKVNNEKD